MLNWCIPRVYWFIRTVCLIMSRWSAVIRLSRSKIVMGTFLRCSRARSRTWSVWKRVKTFPFISICRRILMWRWRIQLVLPRLQETTDLRHLLTAQTHVHLMVIPIMQKRPLRLPPIRHLLYTDLHSTLHHDRLPCSQSRTLRGRPINPQRSHLLRHRPLHLVYLQGVLHSAEKDCWWNG